MDDVNAAHGWTGPGSRARIRVRGSVRCMVRIGLWLHLGLGSDMRATVRLNENVTVGNG